MSFELFIPRVPLSPNRVLRMHWNKRRLYNREIMQEVWLAKNRKPIHGRPQLRDVDVAIELSLFRQKEMDVDNAVAACKPIIDALVEVGILAADDYGDVNDVSVTQIRGPRTEQGSRIKITPSEPVKPAGAGKADTKNLL